MQTQYNRHRDHHSLDKMRNLIHVLVNCADHNQIFSCFRVLFAVFVVAHNWVGRKGESGAPICYHMLILCCTMYISCRFFLHMPCCVLGHSRSVKNWQEIIVRAPSKNHWSNSFGHATVLPLQYISFDVCVMDLFDLPFTQFASTNNATEFVSHFFMWRIDVNMKWVYMIRK